MVFHNICGFIRKKALYRNVEFFKIIRKLRCIIRKNAFRGRWRFYTENVTQVFELTVEQEIIGFVTAVCSYNIFLRVIGCEMIQHGVERFTLIRLLSGLYDDIKEGLRQEVPDTIKFL